YGWGSNLKHTSQNGKDGKALPPFTRHWKITSVFLSTVRVFMYSCLSLSLIWTCWSGSNVSRLRDRKVLDSKPDFTKDLPHMWTITLRVKYLPVCAAWKSGRGVSPSLPDQG
ncbi:hypothetical protein AVEN_76852-1, partial [Araneus ventricosus]